MAEARIVGRKSSAGLGISAATLLLTVLSLALSECPSRAARPETDQPGAQCLACHGEKGMSTTRAGKTVSLYVDGKKFAASVHGSMGCTGCHADLEGKELPHETPLGRVNCGTCHATEQEQHARSLHGKAVAHGDPLAPRCVNCHGNHDIFPVKDPRSAVAPLKVPLVCGQCHREGTPVQRNRLIPESNILENYSESIHGEALLRHLPHTASDLAAYRSRVLDRAPEHCCYLHEVPFPNRGRAPEDHSRGALGEGSQRLARVHRLPSTAQDPECLLYARHGRCGLPALPPGCEARSRARPTIHVRQPGRVDPFKAQQDRLQPVPLRGKCIAGAPLRDHYTRGRLHLLSR
jgi:hypothetical protein